MILYAQLWQEEALCICFHFWWEWIWTLSKVLLRRSGHLLDHFGICKIICEIEAAFGFPVCDLFLPFRTPHIRASKCALRAACFALVHLSGEHRWMATMLLCFHRIFWLFLPLVSFLCTTQVIYVWYHNIILFCCFCFANFLREGFLEAGGWEWSIGLHPICIGFLNAYPGDGLKTDIKF